MGERRLSSCFTRLSVSHMDKGRNRVADELHRGTQYALLEGRMMDYIDLVKRLRDCADIFGACDNNICPTCPNRARCNEHTNDKLQSIYIGAAGAIEALQAAMPKWIPVTERLPEKDGWYQVYAPWYSGGSSSGLKNINGNMYSAFKHGKWSIEVGYHKRPGCVEAWMPLPEPPKKETCETCAYNPPSSCDGKPCTQCDTGNPYLNCYEPKEETE